MTDKPRRKALHDAIDTDYDTLSALLVGKPPKRKLAKKTTDAADDYPQIAGLADCYPDGPQYLEHVNAINEINALRSELARRDKQDAERPLEKLRRDHHRILDTELNNPSRPDGYPTQAFGANTEHSTPSHPVPEDEQGVDTTVERCADTRQRYRTDDYKRDVRNTNAYLQDAALALKAVTKKLHALTTNMPDIEPDTNRIHCWACARVGHIHDHARIVLVNGEEKRPLCAWSYKFRRDNRRMPTEDECTQHARGKRVMVAATKLIA